MKQTLKVFALSSLAGFTLTTTSCNKKGCTDPTAVNFVQNAKKDDGSCIYNTSNGTEIVKGSITENTVWSSDVIYELQGRVVVENNATLTIEPGTIIKGQEGTGVNASALIVARGAKIIASGTADQPIIFTSVLDNIEIGQTTGTSLNEADKGKWGGLIILGNAPISAANGDTESQVEGIPASESYGVFGGNDGADNSGILNYVSIRHGGSIIGVDNEINGLTLGGVGFRTTINNIEIVANLDDGIELFGGTVNITNAVVAFQGDDGIDIDMNYSGTITNFAVVHGVDTDEALEIDGSGGITNTSGQFMLKNGLIKTVDGVGTGADLRAKAQGTIDNVSWEGYTGKIVKIRASFSDTISCIEQLDAYSYLTAVTPTLSIDDAQFITTNTINNVIDVYTNSIVDPANDRCTNNLESTAETTITNSGASLSTAATPTANINNFSWTWTVAKGKL